MFHFSHEMGVAQVTSATAHEAAALHDFPTGRPSGRALGKLPPASIQFSKSKSWGRLGN